MTRVKVCGITRIDDARLAAELGAWAIGLVFHRASPRACDPADAAEIGAALRRRLHVVGVFVNSSLDEVAALAEACSLSAVQLHGDEGPAYCAEVARRTGCRVIKAARARDAASIRALRAFHVDYHLLDAYSPAVRGGTGETFAWELALLDHGGAPLILSGGIDPDNVAEAIATVHPFAVDSASGTEAEPGRKDPAKLRALFRAAEQAAAAGVSA
jgi:phosphoribosylanthranilate isomerase